ncbi:hypothetical protein T484DRAFT_1895242 [Baffinella frigidus]|nr:hypothetical protein T484DRAFT_1895242 [Cryptophyta sp. CCMP2293]
MTDEVSVEVSVVFSLEKSGTLTVAVKNSGTSESLTISNDKGREADLVERAIKDALYTLAWERL